jgi:hypothetical protein
MPFGVNVKDLTAKLDDKFQQLVAELRLIGDKLDTLIDLQRQEAQK